MTAPDILPSLTPGPTPGLTIAELVLPVADAAAATRVAQGLQRELAWLWSEDRAAGLEWRAEVGAVSLDLEPGTSEPAMGAAIARAVQRRARIGEAGR